MTSQTSAVAPRTGDRTRTVWSRVRGHQGRNLWFLVFVAPFLVGLLIFVYIPIVWSAYLSFFDARATLSPTRFVGLENYHNLLSDPLFRNSMLVFIAFAVLIVPLTYVCSLALAIALDNVGPLRTFFRSAFFIPTACSYVVAAMVWRLSFFNGARFGLVNSMVRKFGGHDVDWLSGVGYWYWIALITLRLWLQVGYYMILLIAGLNRIPTDTYEAAAIDGAGRWATLRHVTLPQLRGVSAAVLMLLLIGAFQAFDEFYNLLASSGTYPPYARPPLVHLYMISVGGADQDLGMGGAGTVVLTAIIVIFGLAQNWLMSGNERRERRAAKHAARRNKEVAGG